MAGLIEELMDTVDKQIEIYDELLEIAAKKKTAVIENKIDALSEITAAENTLLGRCSRLDKQRETLFDDIAFVLNKKSEDITLSKLVELIKGQPEEQRLAAIRDRAMDTLNKLKKINDLNRTLIETSLQHIDYSMNVLRGTLNPQPYYYDLAGNEINLPGKMLFDAKQ